MRKAFLFASTALAVASALVVPGAAWAADPPPAAASDPFANRPEGMPPTLRLLQANGVKITSLGDQGGLRGFLLEDQSGKMQTIYLTPDGKGMVVGVLQALSQDGTRIQNVTTLQFAALRERFEEQRRRVDEQRRAADEARARVEEQQRAAEEARRRADAAATALSDQQRQIGAFNPDGTSQAPLSLPGLTGPAPAAAPVTAPVRPVPAPQTAAPAPAPAPVPSAPAAPPPAPAAPPRAELRPAASFASAIPVARFSETVERTPYFRLGAENLPTIYMVADPQCPHCHRAWAQMRPLVESGAIAVKILLIAGLPGSEPLSRNLISQANPAASWWEGQGSEPGKPVATGAAEGSEAARRATGHLEANMSFLRSVNGTGTPWMAFVGRDGKVYQSEGSADVEAFVAALREKGK